MSSPVKILEWDSRFFGCRIARFTAPRLTPALARRADAACGKQRVKCLYFLASSDDASSVRCAEARRFHLTDIRVTLDKGIPSAGMSSLDVSSGSVTYRSARPADGRPLQRLAKHMFPNSRFAADPHFPAGAHEKLFALWIAKSVRGRFDDWVGVAEYGGRLAGFVSCRRAGRAKGVIGLVGVGHAYRRRGIGRGLLSQAEAWFRDQRIGHMSVVTQGRAVTAQRLYQDFGFQTSRVDLWYHKWF